MNNYFKPILLFIMLSCVSHLAQSQNFDDLENQFSVSKVLPHHYFGFALYDLDSNKYVFSKKEDQHFTPASNTKVFTLFSSLKNIGDSIPGIQYVERGDSLIFWGTGDPTFLHPKLDTRRVYNFLKNSNKQLFYASQESAEPPYRNGWSIEDFQEYYQPEIATFPIYGNVVEFEAKGRGVVATPKYFEKTITLREKSARYFSISRDQNQNHFEMSNLNVPRGYKRSKPFIWTDSLFVDLLQDTLGREVQLLKGIEKPQEAHVLYSNATNVVLREMMLPSDNFIAEHLTMVVSGIKYNGFYTDSLRKDMQKEHYDFFQDTIFLRDGSGLSTYNKVTPRSMVELLLAIKEMIPDENQRHLFFPAGGVDGTLRTAYSLDQGVPFVWAKTGTINSVHCQSGYITTRTGRRYAFSFLNNNYAVPTAMIRREMVRIVTFIRQNY